MKSQLIAATALLYVASAFAVSFDCGKASTFVEKEICTVPLLGDLDDALSENYRGMLYSNFGGSKKSLKAAQINWLSSRNKCTNTNCLIDAYRKRIDETCDYGVVSGVHPICKNSDDIQ